jgi:hypothetical protein
MRKIIKTQQISLKYIKPTVLSRLFFGTKKEEILIPKGVTTIVPSDGDASLTVVGTPEGIDELKSMIRLLDVEPAVISAKVRLLERAASSKQATISAQFSLNLLNNTPTVADLLIDGEHLNLSFTAHVNGDSSVSWSIVTKYAEIESTDGLKLYQRQRYGTIYLCFKSPSPSLEDMLNSLGKGSSIQGFLKSIEGKDIQDGALLPPGSYIEITLTKVSKK